MRFMRDRENERGIWVDRGIDYRLDHSEVCEICDAIAWAKEPEGSQWMEVKGTLCGSCQSEIGARALANDILGLSRPLNGSDPNLIIPNDDELEGHRLHPGVLMFRRLMEEDLD